MSDVQNSVCVISIGVNLAKLYCSTVHTVDVAPEGISD